MKYLKNSYEYIFTKKGLYHGYFTENFINFRAVTFVNKRFVASEKINLFINLKKKSKKVFIKSLSQLTFTCSKSTIEILEKGVKHVQR